MTWTSVFFLSESIHIYNSISTDVLTRSELSLQNSLLMVLKAVLAGFSGFVANVFVSGCTSTCHNPTTSEDAKFGYDAQAWAVFDEANMIRNCTHL